MSVFWLQRETVFGFTYKFTVQYKMGCRNRYLKGRDNGQMTSQEYANFISYVKYFCFFVFRIDRWTDRKTDGQIDNEINPGGAG